MPKPPDDHDPPNIHARNTDPDTSHLAVPLNVTEQSLFVLHAYATGLHLLDEEAYARVGWKGHQRCTDLRRLQFIERCGRKNTPFNKAAYLCRITPAGLTYLAINKRSDVELPVDKGLF